ncbi:MAG TPA: NTP transferase domain-containing protein [Candidatus Babeliales bacterium]|jgi:bifunctional UDP-N-acetylglucosamine pyrophosphorylase/glucosamine-1-phosphate N-acetyltransferase|nr:NTP transferase domain-containing protein [Candidatus Babeliales bacterium]
MYPIQAIILAAGMSSRFGLESNKLITPLWGVPLIVHVLQKIEPLDIPITIIIGHQREQIKDAIQTWIKKKSISFVIQEQQKGTGHAIACSKQEWSAEHILILNGDMPLVTQNTITDLYKQHKETNATASFVTAIPDTVDHAYGRVIHDNEIIKIVESKDFVGNRSMLYPINAGIYLFKRDFLYTAIDRLTTNNASKEFYLTDLIGLASVQQNDVSCLQVPFDTIRGVNTTIEFAQVSAKVRNSIVNQWMQKGILCHDPEHVYIDAGATIGKGTILHPGVHIRGNSSIGEHCEIDANTIIKNSIVQDHAIIGPHCFIDNSYVPKNRKIEPFIHVNNATDSVWTATNKDSIIQSY